MDTSSTRRCRAAFDPVGSSGRWVKALHKVANGSDFVFPKRRRDRRQRALHVGIDTLNAALAGVDHGLDEFTIHDLRRTMRTHLSSLGIRSEVAERCLKHKLPGIQGVHNTHDYFAERRVALETRLDKRRSDHDEAITAILSAICQLMNPPASQRRGIGCTADLDHDK